MFLQEAEATVVMFDLRGFSHLAGRLGPLELGTALGRYYEHIESIVLAHQGRIVKFMADVVMAAWISSEVEDYRKQAVAAVWESYKKRGPWVQKGITDGQPVLDYSVAAATGPILVGQIGTDRLKFFDVLGEPVSVALKLTTVATVRQVAHILTSDCLESPTGRLQGIEVEGIELGGKPLRLYKLD